MLLAVLKRALLIVLAPTKKATLTLVTCYPFHMIGPAPKRFIVRGHLVRQKTQSNFVSRATVLQIGTHG